MGGVRKKKEYKFIFNALPKVYTGKAKGETLKYNNSVKKRVDELIKVQGVKSFYKLAMNTGEYANSREMKKDTYESALQKIAYNLDAI